MDRLEQEGYGARINTNLDEKDGGEEDTEDAATDATSTHQGMTGRRPETHIVSPATEHIKDLDEEERRFQSELQRVTVEDVDGGD